MIDKIYNLRQEELEKENIHDREILSQKLNDVRLEEIEILVSSNSEIMHKLKLLIENYELEIGYYSEKNYKQGFKDGVQLVIESLK